MKVDELIPAVFSSTKDMCETLEVTKGAVSQWRKHGIPDLRQYQIREVVRQRKAMASEAA